LLNFRTKYKKPRTMVKFDIEIRLSNILIVVAEGEGQIDNIRTVISERSDFDPVALFNEIDSHTKGYLDVEDISRLFL
jgi:hypothetical protein